MSACDSSDNKNLDILKNKFGIWWPAYDHKLEKAYDHVLKHLRDMDTTVDACRKRRVCIQAGGNVGLWPRRLSKFFRTVMTFEPQPAAYECLIRNCELQQNVWAYNYGLGAKQEELLMRTNPSAARWKIDPEGTERVLVVAIDQYHLGDCDAIFLDVEGHEVEALKGAQQTIERCRPAIHLEVLPRFKDAIHRHLLQLKYKHICNLGYDQLYLPQEYV